MSLTVEMRDHVEVERRNLTLGDVSHISGDNAADIAQLQSIALGRVPVSSLEMDISREHIVHWVKSRAGSLAGAMVWTGADHTRISVKASTVPGAHIQAMARTTLEKWLAIHARRSEIEDIDVAHDLKVPAGQVELKSRTLAQELPLSRQMMVWVDIRVDGEFIHSIPVTFAVKAFRQVYVSRGNYAVGSTIGRRDVEVQEVDVSRSGEAGMENLNALFDEPSGRCCRLRLPLEKGQVLTRKQLQAVPEVTRGDWAVLKAVSPGVVLESRVQVLQDGVMGQWVNVKMPAASASIRAVVTAPGTVEVMQ